MIQLATQDATENLARAMRPHLRPGDTLLLNGQVGVGKSAFARALIQDAMAVGGGAIEPVPSPTFTLVQVYDTPCGAYWHADLYRLGSSGELAELGLDEAFETAITLVEWPERLGAAKPARYLDLTLYNGEGDDARTAALLPTGPRWDWIDVMRQSFSTKSKS